jgi:hypothetical protein
MNGEGGRRRDGKGDKLMGGPEGMCVLAAASFDKVHRHDPVLKLLWRAAWQGSGRGSCGASSREPWEAPAGLRSTGSSTA